MLIEAARDRGDRERALRGAWSRMSKDTGK
jgi:hypothetical protein